MLQTVNLRNSIENLHSTSFALYHPCWIDREQEARGAGILRSSTLFKGGQLDGGVLSASLYSRDWTEPGVTPCLYQDWEQAVLFQCWPGKGEESRFTPRCKAAWNWVVVARSSFCARVTEGLGILMTLWMNQLYGAFSSQCREEVGDMKHMLGTKMGSLEVSCRGGLARLWKVCLNSLADEDLKEKETCKYTFLKLSDKSTVWLVCIWQVRDGS